MKRPDGYYHGLITLFLMPVAFTAGVVWGVIIGDAAPIILVTLGNLAGLFIEPDLDQEMVTSSEWRVVKLLGPLPGSIWSAFWMPYAMLMKHRGMSHWPIIGTLTRALYLLVPAVVVSIVAVGHALWVWDYLPYMIQFFVGLCISDIGHWVRDFSFSPRTK